MTVSDLEKILWDTLDINDGVNFDLEALTFKKAEKRPEWADNPDADGAVLVQEAHYTNAYFEGQIRVVRAEDTDAALEALGRLTDALQSMERTDGGLPIPWTPNGSTRTYTWYALLGETPELPTEIDGELAGWFLASPVVKFKLTCRPFGYRDQRVVLAETPSTAPLQVVYIDGIEGDVPAEGTLRITDKAEQDRRYMEWGQDVLESAEGNPDLELKAEEDLVVEGYSGELAVRSGSTSGKVVKATLRQTALVLCSTGPIAHIGSFRSKLRCQAEGEGTCFHISYRVGQGNWVTSLPWWTPSRLEEWCELDQGELFLEEAEQGEQISEIRVEGKVEEGADHCIGYVDVLGLIPTRRYGVAHEPLDFDVPTSLLVADVFNQSEGNATGKEAEAGGIYAAVTNSDTTDFTITKGKLKRASVSDSGTIGTFASRPGRGIGTSKELTDIAMSNSFRIESADLTELIFGQMLSYVDNEHFILVCLHYGATKSKPTPHWSLFGLRPDGSGHGTDVVRTPLASSGVVQGGLLSVIHGSTMTVYVSIPGGNWQQELQFSDVLVGSKGKAFVYDENTSALKATREYDGLAIWEPDQPIVCAAGQSLEIRCDAEEREDTGGTYWSPVHYRGAHFLLDPAGDSGLVNRLAVKTRRNDIAEEPDTSLADEQSLEVLASERVLAPR